MANNAMVFSFPGTPLEGSCWEINLKFNLSPTEVKLILNPSKSKFVVVPFF